MTFQPACSISDGKFRAGLWIRDSSAGVGTLTFYEPESRVFAGLGHAICDVDTGEEMPLLAGDIVDAHINGCYKGTKGAAGELCGVFGNRVMGSLAVNGNTGVYGVMNAGNAPSGKAIPVALRQEVKTGPAQIISTVDGKAPQYYDVEITKIYSGPDTQVKNMIVEVTDSSADRKNRRYRARDERQPQLSRMGCSSAQSHMCLSTIRCKAMAFLRKACCIPQKTLRLRRKSRLPNSFKTAKHAGNKCFPCFTNYFCVFS